MSENVTVIGGEMPEAEINAYIHHVKAKNPNRKLESIQIEMDGEFVNLNYRLAPEPFEHIRRITGYLVGDMSHWNDAKKAEEADRVKHSMTN